jgi:hypothetical protein
MIGPVYPFENGEFHSLCVAPRSPAMDHLGLEQAVDGFGESIVAGIADGSPENPARFTSRAVFAPVKPPTRYYADHPPIAVAAFVQQPRPCNARSDLVARARQLVTGFADTSFSAARKRYIG